MSAPRKPGPKGTAAADVRAGSPEGEQLIRVQAHVARRRAGRAWAAGDVMEFGLRADGSPDAGEALTQADLDRLLADPGFTVTKTEPGGGTE